eukprot:SAG31_NODE_13099_length_892_cov_1.696091_1_plen_217_part_10
MRHRVQEALRAKLPFMVCHSDTIRKFIPERTDTWGSAKAEVYMAFGLADDPSDVRLCRCQGMTDFFGEAILNSDATPVVEIPNLQNTLLVIERKSPETTWLHTHFATAPNDEAQVFFSEIGGEEPVHVVKVNMNSQIKSIKEAIAPILGTEIKPEEIKLRKMNGMIYTGIQRISLKGETPAYGTENLCAAVQAIAARGEPVSTLAIQRQINEQTPVG